MDLADSVDPGPGRLGEYCERMRLSYFQSIILGKLMSQ